MSRSGNFLTFDLEWTSAETRILEFLNKDPLELVFSGLARNEPVALESIWFPFRLIYSKEQIAKMVMVRFPQLQLSSGEDFVFFPKDDKNFRTDLLGNAGQLVSLVSGGSNGPIEAYFVKQTDSSP